MWRRFPLILAIAVLLCGCRDVSLSLIEAVQEDSAALAEAGAVASESAAPPPAGRVREFQHPHDVLVEGRHAVDVMELVAPPRFAELAERMRQAIAEDPLWWAENPRKAQPGQPLPYDARMGFLESEYQEFLTLAKTLKAQKVGEAILTITTNDEGIYVLDGGNLDELTGIEIDLPQDRVYTPFGILTERSEINAGNDSALGAWTGVQWKLEAPGPEGSLTGTVVKLAMGKLRESGRAVIYYDVKKVERSGAARISRVLNFDPQ